MRVYAQFSFLWKSSKFKKIQIQFLEHREVIRPCTKNINWSTFYRLSFKLKKTEKNAYAYSWRHFVKKIENNLLPIPSTRAIRYFGPSKMSFFNLIKHSLSIMSVFRKTFLIRSALFIILYILFIKSNASVITALPLVFLLIAVYAISNLALRENMEEFDKALLNITDIENIK